MSSLKTLTYISILLLCPAFLGVAQLQPQQSTEDPLLAPLPPPSKNIRNWDDVSILLNARSVDLRTALREVERNQGLARIALGALLPTASATGAVIHHFFTNDTPISVVDANGQPGLQTFTLPTPNIIQASVSVEQPLINLAAWHTWRTSKLQTEQSRDMLQHAKRLIALNAASAILAVVTAERVTLVGQESLRAALTRIQNVEQRQALGAANALDVIRAKQDAQNARAVVVSARENVRKARESLGLILGLAEPVGVTPKAHIAELSNELSNNCKQVNTLSERSDLIASQKRIQVADRQTDAIYLSMVPTLSARSDFTTTTLETGAYPQTLWNIQAVLSVPIWDGGVRYGRIAVAKAQTSGARDQAEAIERQANIELIQTRRSIEVAEEKRKVAQDAKEQASEVHRLTETAFREGRGNSLELILAASALRQAESNQIIQEFELARAKLNMLLVLSNCE